MDRKNEINKQTQRERDRIEIGAINKQTEREKEKVKRENSNLSDTQNDTETERKIELEN